MGSIQTLRAWFVNLPIACGLFLICLFILAKGFDAQHNTSLHQQMKHFTSLNSFRCFRPSQWPTFLDVYSSFMHVDTKPLSYPLSFKSTWLILTLFTFIKYVFHMKFWEHCAFAGVCLRTSLTACFAWTLTSLSVNSLPALPSHCKHVPT